MRKKKTIFFKFISVVSCFFGLVVAGCDKKKSDPISWLKTCIYKNFNSSDAPNKISNIVNHNKYDKSASNNPTVIFYKNNKMESLPIPLGDFTKNNIKNVYFDKENAYDNIVLVDNYFSSSLIYCFTINFQLNVSSVLININFPMVIVLKGGSINLSNNNNYIVATSSYNKEENPLISSKYAFNKPCDLWWTLLNKNN